MPPNAAYAFAWSPAHLRWIRVTYKAWGPPVPLRSGCWAVSLPVLCHSNHSRTVTIRAGQKPIWSYEPRWCAENNVAVKAARDRRTSVSHRPQRKAIFLSGSGGLSFDKTKESLPNSRLPVEPASHRAATPPNLRGEVPNCRAPHAPSRINPARGCQSPYIAKQKPAAYQAFRLTSDTVYTATKASGSSL